MRTTLRKHKGGTDRYLELVREFPLKAIRTSAEHERAMEVVSRLAIKGEDALSAGERDYLEALMVLIEGYDLMQQPWRRTSGLELLQHLVEESGMSLAELGRIVGSRPLASLILLGKREISRQVMRRLGAHFKVNPGVFM